MIDTICFVIKNGLNQYLADYDNLSNEEAWVETVDKAWKYTSHMVWADAEDTEQKVYILLPSGREIEVSKEDFKQ